MKYFLLSLILIVSVSAYANTGLDCRVARVSKGNDVDESNTPVTANIKSATIEITGNRATLEAKDKNGRSIEFSKSSGKGTVAAADFTYRRDKSKRGRKAYQATNVAVADVGYGDQFWLYVSNNGKSVTLWSAAISEASDETGVQELAGSVNVYLTCEKD